jgi:methyl-accepting chemotaxis protein
MEDFLTYANNLEEISGSVNVKTSKMQTQNEFYNIKDGNVKDLEEIEAILLVMEHYERSLLEAKQWLDSFESKIGESEEDINKCVQDELGSDFRLDEESYPPKLVQAISEGKKASDLLSGSYIAAYDIEDLYEQWSQMLSQIQGIQESDKAKIKKQHFESKYELYKNSLEEIIEETISDDDIDWLYPASIESLITSLKAVSSKLKKEHKELNGISESMKESNIMMLEGANQVNSDFKELTGEYHQQEQTLKQQINDAEQCLPSIKEYEKKKEDVSENLRLVKEKLNKILFPMDPQD